MQPPMPFVVGAPRSGTTLLRLMLDAHPALAIPPETGFLRQAARLQGEGDALRDALFTLLTQHPAEVPNWADFGLDAGALRAALDAIAPFDVAEGVRAFYRLYAARFDKRRYGDKTPLYCLHLAELEALLPEAHFVHLVRDGRDVALSLRDTWFAPARDAEGLARHWVDWVSTARRTGARARRYLEVRYEELVEKPQPVLEQICAFVDLPFDAALLRHHERAAERLAEHRERRRRDGTLALSLDARRGQQRRTLGPPDASRVLAWRREMAADERARFDSVAGPLLRELGYEVVVPSRARAAPSMTRFLQRILPRRAPSPPPPSPRATEEPDDAALRARLERELPVLADPAAGDRAKVEALRGFVYANVADASFAACLDVAEPAFRRWTTARILRELEDRNAGFKCAGTAYVLHRLCALFGFASCVYDAGDRAGGRASHAVVVVELSLDGVPTWAVLDPYFDLSLCDRSGGLLDVRRLLDRLGALRHASVRAQPSGRERRFVMGEDERDRIAALERAGARRIGTRAGRVVYAGPSSPAAWAARHPELAAWARREVLPSDSLYLLLSPRGIEGELRFAALPGLADARRAALRSASAPLRIVYAPGKTGTQTLERALRLATPEGRVERTHLLARGELRRLEAALAAAPRSRFAAAQRAQLEHARGIRHALAERAWLRRRFGDVPRPELVIGVRDPVSRMLASLFQQLDAYFPDPADATPEAVAAFLSRDPDPAADAVAQLVDGNRTGLHDWWFERELRASFRLDVFATPFPHEAGHQVIEGSRARAFVLRLEDLDRLAEPLARFLGVAQVQLVPVNRGDDRPWAAAYRACREACRFRPDVVDRLLGSRLAMHFYTASERARLRARWIR